MRLSILINILIAAIRLIVFVAGVITQNLLGYPIETFRLTPAGVKQVPTRYRFSMSAKKGRRAWKRRLR